MLSLKDIQRILASGKPVVWTMHDMWPFTGICHYSGECEKYTSQCHDCPLLLKPHHHDLSEKTFHKKQKLYATAPITFIACSRWLESMARRSSLLQGHTITNIPNAINTNLFKPRTKKFAREKLNLPADKKLLLFGSMKITDKRNVTSLTEAAADAKLDQLKSQDMQKAQDAADELLDASDKDAFGMLIQDAVDHIDEKQEEEKEKAEEAQEKRDEQQEKIDEKKEEKQQQEKMIEGSVEADRLEADVTVDQTGTSKLEEAQQHIQTILKKNNLVNEDLKGIKIDLNF
jgi:hypothetical protein